MKNLLTIQPKQETEKIVTFLQKTVAEQNIPHAVVGLSGGIDSATSLFLLTKALPKEHIHVVHMPYFGVDQRIETIVKAAGIPKEQTHSISIKTPVDTLQKTLGVNADETVRLGNIMARVRMIILFDMAKKHKALVCGTENKSEYHLSYFTRFGDEASDIEPIQHLYKTQIYALATYLGVPQAIMDAPPSAGLWDGQTDEAEFGFTYKDADAVLYRYFDQKESVETIQKDLPNAEKIIEWTKKNDFKHKVPYILDPEINSG